MPARLAQASDWRGCAGRAGVGRQSLREIETEVEAKEFQNRNSTFSGSLLTKMLKVEDAQS
jgi:hypothetical protein